MFRFLQGDILKSKAEALVNPVNCVGVAGKGLALQFKTAFPDNFKTYVEVCKRGDVVPGRMLVYEIPHRSNMISPRYIINFPTKRHWRNKSHLEDIVSGLQALAQVVRDHNINSVAVPALGCGLGGLPYPTVRSLIVAILGTDNLPDKTDVTVYTPLRRNNA